LEVKKVYEVAKTGGGASSEEGTQPAPGNGQEAATPAGLDPIVVAVLKVTSEKYRERGYGGFLFGISEEETSRLLSAKGIKIIPVAQTAKSQSPSESHVTTVNRDDGSEAFCFDAKHHLIAVEQIYTANKEQHLAKLLESLGEPDKSDIKSVESTDSAGGRVGSPQPSGMAAGNPTNPGNAAVRGTFSGQDVRVVFRDESTCLRYSFPSAIVYVTSRTHDSHGDDGQAWTAKSVQIIVFDRKYALAQLTLDMAEKRKIVEWLRKVMDVSIQDRPTIRQFPTYPGTRLRYQQPSKGHQQFNWQSLDGKLFATVTKNDVATGNVPKGTVEIRLALDSLPGHPTNALRGLILENMRANVFLAKGAFAPDEAGITTSNDRGAGWRTADGWDVFVTSGVSVFSRKPTVDKGKPPLADRLFHPTT
jgi:hypothetical protein